MAFTIVQSEGRRAAANRLQDHHPARGGRRGMVETRSKSRPVKDRLTASGRGGEGLRGSRAVNAYISAKISEPSFHGVTIDPVVVKSEKAGYLLDWSPQSKRSRPQQTAGSSEF